MNEGRAIDTMAKALIGIGVRTLDLANGMRRARETMDRLAVEMNRCWHTRLGDVNRTRCCLPRGHNGRHNGWVHFGSGAYVTSWDRAETTPSVPATSTAAA